MVAGAMLWATAAHATTYKYVSPDGVDSSTQDGSDTAPWKTLRYALTRVTDDCVVTVYGSGDPNNPYVIRDTDQASLDGADLYVVAPNRDVRIDGSLHPSSHYGIVVAGIRNTLEGFEIVNCQRSGAVIAGDYGTIRDCKFHDNPGTAIFSWYDTNCRIENNEIYNNGYLGGAPPYDITHGVYLAHSTNMTFIHNVVRGNAEIGLHSNGNYKDINSNVTIDGNIFVDNGLKAVDLMNTHDSHFINNLCYGDNDMIKLVSDSDDGNGNNDGAMGSFRNVIANNTFVSPTRSTLIWLSPPNGDPPVGPEDCVVFNNIVISASGSQAIVDSGTNDQIGTNYTATYSTNLLSSLFEDPTNNDYRIKSGSPADDAGVDVFAGRSAPSVDLLGMPRVTPYDLGAYELSGTQQGYLLGTSVEGGGAVTKSPAKASYSAAETVTLTAVPDAGWSFSNWSGGLTGSTNPASITTMSDTSVTAVFILSVNDPPVADFVATPTTGTAPLSVSFDASASSDPDGDPLSFFWNFGDGSTASGVVTSHTYGSAGSYTAVVAVTDNHAHQDTQQVSVVVTAPPTPPAAPSGVAVAASGTDCATVTWSPNTETNLAGYVVYYGQQSVEQGTVAQYGDSVDVGNLTSKQLCGLSPGTYYFAVRAYDTDQLKSPYSGETSVVITAPPTPPAAPSGVAVAASGTDCATVTWSPNTETNLAGYVVYYGQQSVEQGTVAQYGDSVDVGNLTSKQLCGLSPGTYYFAVRAYDTDQLKSPYSGETSVVITAPDTVDPVVEVVSPLNGASNVPLNAEILFNVSDAGSGVDMGSVAVLIDGVAPAQMTHSGAPASYSFTCTPASQLPASATVTVSVTASDLASPANTVSASWSFATSAKPPTPPAAPTGLVAQTGGADCASLAWNANSESDLSGYVVYYGLQSVEQGVGSQYTNSIDVGNTTSQNVCGLAAGTWYFAIRAYDVDREFSAYSAEGSVTITAPDTGDPTVQAMNPANGASNVPLDSRIRFDVSDAGAGVDIGSLTVLINGSAPAQVTHTGTAASYSVTCTPASQLPASATVTVSVSVSDLASPANSVSTNWSFATAAAPDADGPTILVVGPANGEAGVPTNTKVYLVLSDASGVDKNTVSVLIDGAAPAAIAYTGSADSYSLACTPAATLAPNSDVTVDVSVKDLASPANESTHSWTFTTGSTPPATPTGLSAQGTDTGDANLAWNANPEPDVTGYWVYYASASVAFGDAGSYEDSTYVTTTSYSWPGLADGTHFFALRAVNESGQLSQYSGEVSAPVTNGSTQGPLPPQSVQVAEVQPGCVSVSWRPNSEPDVTGYKIFYGPQSVAQGESAIYLGVVDVKNKSAGQVCNLDTDTYYFAVRAYTSSGSESGYSVEKSINVLGVDVEGPVLTLVYPPNGSVDVPQNTEVFLLFADALSGVDTNSIDILINGFAPSSVTYSGDASNRAAVCHLDQPLPAGSAIAVQVTVSDLAQPSNSTSATWTFTTGNATDTTPPSFPSHYPPDLAQSVDPYTDIVVEVGDDVGIDPTRIELYVNDQLVSKTVSSGQSGNTIVSRAGDEALPPGRIQVRVVAYDVAGNHSQLVYSFEIASAVLASDRPTIVPDGFWADDPSRPLEVRNLSLDWGVRIFNAAGEQVRSFKNSEQEGLVWVWDFSNGEGRRVASGLYLVVVVDDQGDVRQSGKFLVR